MDFFNSLRQFLGIPKRDQQPNNRYYADDNSLNQFWDDQRQPNGDMFGREDPMTFSIFSNPLEIHRYFEHQMNEMMKNMFGFEEHNPFESFSFSEPFNFPSLEEGNPDEPVVKSGSLRDQFLKPGYESPKPHNGLEPPQKFDSDIDQKFHTKDLDLLLKDENPKQSLQKYQPKTQFFGQTTQFKTIHHPDGRTEITKIVKDNQGNEEKTVTYKFGDKEHTVVTRRDKDGKEEITENLVNMDSNDLNKLWMKDEKANDIAELKTPKTWFPFDFFK